MEQFHKVMVTGSAGYLGSKICEALKKLNIPFIGVDVISKDSTESYAKYEPIYKISSPNLTRCGNEIYTTHCGSVSDKKFVDELIKGHKVDLIFHTAALHKPNVDSNSMQDFIDTNITGTLNLLESAVAHKTVKAFIFTSTTSLFGDAMVPTHPGAPAVRVTEELVPKPKNIYGVTKLAAENVCRLVHAQQKLPIMVLRTSRFFPEEDDVSALQISDKNLKAIEYLYRRVDVRDIVDIHFQAALRAPQIGFDTFIISAVPPPFTDDDLLQLYNNNAPSIIEKYYPEYPKIFQQLGWQMLKSLDRVYYPSKAQKLLGFSPKFDFLAHLHEHTK